MPNRLQRHLGWMFLTALLLRLAVCAALYQEQLNPAKDHWAFGWEMGRVARSICEGHGFSSPLFEPSGPTAWMAPGYPYLLAACMRLFGVYTAQSAWAILFLNSLFASLTVIPLYFLAQRVIVGARTGTLSSGAELGDRAAWLAAWIWVFFPYSIYLSADRIWENTLTCLLATLIWLQTLRLETSGQLRQWLIWGALWGVAAMVSPVMLITLPGLGVWLIVRRHRTGQRWFWPALVSALVFLSLLLPWTIRNQRAFHRFVPLRDNFWLEMHVGNNGDTSDITPDSSHPTTNPAEYAQWKQLGEIGYMDAKKVETKAFLRAHPGFFAWVSLRRFAYVWTGFWSLDAKFLAEEPFHIPNAAFTIALSVLFLLGMAYVRKEVGSGGIVPLALVVITFPLLYYFSHPAMDYRHPLDPIIVIFGSYCVSHWLKWRRPAPSLGRARVQARFDRRASRIVQKSTFEPLD